MFLLHYMYAPRVNNALENICVLGTITPYEQNKIGPQYRYGLMIRQIEEMGFYATDTVTDTVRG